MDLYSAHNIPIATHGPAYDAADKMGHDNDNDANNNHFPMTFAMRPTTLYATGSALPVLNRQAAAKEGYSTSRDVCQKRQHKIYI